MARDFQDCESLVNTPKISKLQMRNALCEECLAIRPHFSGVAARILLLIQMTALSL